MEQPEPDIEIRPTSIRWWVPGAVAGVALASALVLVLVYHVAPLAGLDIAGRQLPSVLLQRAEEDFVAAGYDLTPAVSRDAREAAREAPLEAAPFYFAAMGHDESREPEKIIELLDAALARDPRHYYARLWRARMYYKTERLPEAIVELERVISHDNVNAADYVEALIDLARDPRSHSYLLKRIAATPPWGDDFIRRANDELVDEDFLLALTSQSSTALNDYVRRLTSKGEFERAFLIWQASLTESQLMTFSWPTDPTFSPKAEQSPFGWDINSRVATPEDDGLDVFYSGRGEWPVASQTIMLGPGYGYKLTVSMAGEVDARGGRLQWNLRCVESGRVIATLDVAKLKDRALPYSVDAVVPDEGCPVQSLALTARPGEFPFPARLTVQEVEIREDAQLESAELIAPSVKTRSTRDSSRQDR